MSRASLPRVICHMLQSLDGKVTGDFLSKPQCESATDVYFQLHRQCKANGFACGRVTMEESFTGGWKPDLTPFSNAKLSRADYIADGEASYYAVAFDRHGRLGWQDSYIHDDDSGYDGAHIIEVLCEKVSDAYLAYLRSIGVSYIFAGEREMDLQLALAKLKREFGIYTLLLEGGSMLNGSFLQEDLVDELSLVIAPLTASHTERSIFYNDQIAQFTLSSVRRHDDSVISLHYKKGTKK